MAEVSIARLHEVFRLDADTGRLFWRVRKAPHVPAGSEAGAEDGRGYRDVRVDGKRFYVHRIVFAMAYGRWPQGDTDHINMDKTDNRPENLREATRTQNIANMGLSRANTSGVKGVHWCSFTGKWRASIRVGKRTIRLGRFDDLEEAGRVYAAAALKYHGEFARVA